MSTPMRRGDLIAIGNPQDRKCAARQSPWGAQRLYVDDAHWQETVTMLSRDADPVSMQVMGCGGRSDTCCKAVTPTLFFLNPSIDVQTRTRQLMEDFGVSAADLASVDVHRILALRMTSPDQLILMLCDKPERDAYLVAARLAFEDQAGGLKPRPHIWALNPLRWLAFERDVVCYDIDNFCVLVACNSPVTRSMLPLKVHDPPMVELKPMDISLT
jgi:hypothetical protein